MGCAMTILNTEDGCGQNTLSKLLALCQHASNSWALELFAHLVSRSPCGVALLSASAIRCGSTPSDKKLAAMC
jgi:hypothetical protein